MPDRASLIRLIESKTGWTWEEHHDDFFNADAHEYGEHVGMDAELLDGIVAWAGGRP